jgi:hypothetical protein
MHVEGLSKEIRHVPFIFLLIRQTGLISSEKAKVIEGAVWSQYRLSSFRQYRRSACHFRGWSRLGLESGLAHGNTTYPLD